MSNTVLIDIDHLEDINIKKLQEMTFIYNALENGWVIHKKNDYYTFIKVEEGKKEIFSKTYLSTFIEKNRDLNTLSDYTPGH